MGIAVSTVTRGRGITRASRPERVLAATVEVLADTLGLRDLGSAVHSGRVKKLASVAGRRLGLGRKALRELGFAASLHDIGKVGVPDAVLLKPGPLDRDEWVVIQEHSAWGAELIARIPGLERVAMIVRHHHERFDGGGYPDGIAGEQIPLESRILCVADAYVAITEDRPYRGALDHDAACRELRTAAETQFDPAVVDALLLELGR